MFVQLCAGLVFAASIAVVAYRLGALTPSGAMAAISVGTVIFAAGGISWSAVLLAFFATSSALSHLHHSPRDITAKGGRRDAWQVLANGGVPALLALTALFVPGPNWFVPYAGALAAATSDTWATEIGGLSRAMPRLITTGHRVSPGTSGGVTFLGIAASIVGATVVAVFAALAGLGTASLIVVLAGILGSVTDSILGATIQEIRRCPVCLTTTEQIRHVPCNARTEVVGGVPGLNNDGINALVGVAAALVATVVAILTGRM